MPAQKLKAFLDDNHVKYVTITHSPAYTAQEVAESAHVSGDSFAKSVVVKLDGRLALAVLPATRQVGLDNLKQAADADSIELASEQEFKDRFPGCEPGAMPPFGNLYDMDVYVSSALATQDQIAFNAGTHTELVQLAYTDLEKLAKPSVASF